MPFLPAPAGTPPGHVTEPLLDSYGFIESVPLKPVPVPGPSQAGLGRGAHNAGWVISYLDDQSTRSNNAGALPSWAANAPRNLLPAGKK